MNLPKALDRIPLDLLFAKLRAYGLTIDALTFLCSYLKHLKPSSFRILLSGVPRGSIVGPILFNVFLNELFLFVTKAKSAILLMNTQFMPYIKILKTFEGMRRR